jgi:hypothetical protein
MSSIMNRSSAFVLVSSLGVAAASTILACEDTSSQSPDYDAGAYDASFQAPEASTPDSFVPDAPQEAAPSNTATVIVTKAGAPDPGVTVVFEDAAGNLVGSAVTGADGKASSVVVAGSQITVLFGAAGSRQLITYLGVKPGDVLNVVERAPRSVTITTPASTSGGSPTILAGNFNCYVNAVSTGPGTPVLIDLQPECITGTTFPVLGTLVSSGRYFSFKKDITPAASGGTIVSGLSSWTLGAPFTLDVTNAPTVPGATAYAYLGQIANLQSASFGSESAFTLVGGAGTASFSVATGYADAYQGDVQFVDYDVPSNIRVLSVSKRIAAPASAQALDLAPGVLPQLTGINVTGTTRAVVAWTAAASLATTDSGVVSVTWSQPIDGGSAENVEWTFIVPPDTLTLTLPQLPGQFSAFAPDASSAFELPSVGFFESDLIPSYDVVRAQAGAFGLTRVPVSLSRAQVPALPANGTLRITAMAPGG